MKLELVTAPLADFVSTAEAARNVFGDATYDATKLERDIKAAIRAAEHYTGLAFINQVWKMTLDQFPPKKSINKLRAIYLPKGKVQSLTGDLITYYDENGTAQTLALNTDFYLDNVGENARLIPVTDWPETKEGRPNNVVIEWTAGYGTTLPTHMNDVKDAVLVKIGDLYELRQSLVPGTQVNNVKVFEMLLHPYKNYLQIDIYNA